MTHKTFVGSGQLKAHDRIRYDTPPALPGGAAEAAGAGTPPGRFMGPLTDVQWQAVGVLFLTHARPRVRARAAAILLSAQGLSVRQIAEVLRVRRQSVRKWFD